MKEIKSINHIFIKVLLDQLIKIINFLSGYNNLKYILKLKKFLLSLKSHIIFIVEEDNWAIEWVGKYICENLKKLNLLDANIATYFISHKKIIHFGSLPGLFHKEGLIRLKKGNISILTMHHIDYNDPKTKFLPLLKNKIDLFHTSCSLTLKEIIKMGIQEEKVIIIPLGVDLDHFKTFDNATKLALKKKYNLPTSKFIIGSFQKDGVGWGEGLEPKLIKGPDILCEVLKKLNNEIDIHVLLTGPARGYVKEKLKEYNISYTHIFLKNYKDIVECYNTLDLYIVSSRVEGGPLAILECMATSVPVVATKVGMVPEVIEHKLNGMISEIDNVDSLYKNSLEILKNIDLRNRIIKNAKSIIPKYSWENIAMQYYKKMYIKFL